MSKLTPISPKAAQQVFGLQAYQMATVKRDIKGVYTKWKAGMLVRAGLNRKGRTVIIERTRWRGAMVSRANQCLVPTAELTFHPKKFKQ
jgi:hypothetical protein